MNRPPETASGTTAPGDSRTVIGVRVDLTSYSDATERAVAWAREGESRYICACNVHMVMEAHDDTSYRGVINGADLVTPDGVPIVWALRLLGAAEARRVYGPDLMLALCAEAERQGIPVGLYGGQTAVLERLQDRLRELYPALDITYACSPPYGPIEVRDEDVTAIAESGAKFLFVALGCPKQERWMALHRGRVEAVMVGVGAAFDFIAGTKPQAPGWLQRIGLEWAFRLATEPRRLWRRYAYHNPRFIARVAHQWLGAHRQG